MTARPPLLRGRSQRSPRVRRWLRKLLAVRDSPEAIARGMAVGFFFGVSLLWGLQLALAIGAAWLVRGNRVIAAAMTAVSNPLTTVPLYGLCYGVGRLLVGGEGALPDLSAIRSLGELRAVGPQLLWPLLAGTTAVGVAGSAALYLGAGRVLAWFRRRRALRAVAARSRCTRPSGARRPPA